VERPPYRCGSAAGARELSGIVVHTHDRNPSFSRIDRSFSFRTARFLSLIDSTFFEYRSRTRTRRRRRHLSKLSPLHRASPLSFYSNTAAFFLWCVRVLLPIVSQIVSSSLVSFRFVRLGHGEVRSHDRWCVCVVL